VQHPLQDLSDDNTSLATNTSRISDPPPPNVDGGINGIVLGDGRVTLDFSPCIPVHRDPWLQVHSGGGRG